MNGYTKLYASITTSTIWSESSDTRVVWITMLAMSDKYGRVFASIPGLARVSVVSLENTEIALKKFLAPDKYSRTPDNEGRRIVEIVGGWQLLNYPIYREQQDEEHKRQQAAVRAKRYRDKGKGGVTPSVTMERDASRTVTQNHPIAEAEAKAVTTTERDASRPPAKNGGTERQRTKWAIFFTCLLDLVERNDGPKDFAPRIYRIVRGEKPNFDPPESYFIERTLPFCIDALQNLEVKDPSAYAISNWKRGNGAGSEWIKSAEQAWDRISKKDVKTLPDFDDWIKNFGAKK